MKFSEQVFELAENFMTKSLYVIIRGDMIEALAHQMKNEPVYQKYEQGPDPDTYKTILIELVASSINYCYWYGSSKVRPGNSSSTTMYSIVETTFDEFNFESQEDFVDCIDIIQKALLYQRFPLVEERIRHLNELIAYGQKFATFIQTSRDFEECFAHLITFFPGFGSDLFLKRASLFFIQLYRRYKWFADEMFSLHVPADYQIPKMLSHFECIEYSSILKDTIDFNSLIPKHSVMECEIRSATILVIRELCKLTGWNVSDVDGWLFTKRHEPTRPFHLTVTTDY